MDWWVLHDKVNKHRKFKCYMSVEKNYLEDTIEYLEASCMELEIKSLDETGTKKKLLGKVLLKKKKDLEMKQNELAETTKLID